MNEHNKNLDFTLEEVDNCNDYFCNHVGLHKEAKIRKGIIIGQVIAIIAILLLIVLKVSY